MIQTGIVLKVNISIALQCHMSISFITQPKPIQLSTQFIFFCLIVLLFWCEHGFLTPCSVFSLCCSRVDVMLNKLVWHWNWNVCDIKAWTHTWLYNKLTISHEVLWALGIPAQNLPDEILQFYPIAVSSCKESWDINPRCRFMKCSKQHGILCLRQIIMRDTC